MPRILLISLIAYAAVGLTLSLGLHLLSFSTIRVTGADAASFAVPLALFPLFLAAVLVWTKLSQIETPLRPSAGAIVLPGCPAWLRLTIRALYFYVPVDFAIYLAWSFAGTPTHGLAPVWGLWMFLYAYALMIFLVAWRRA